MKTQSGFDLAKGRQFLVIGDINLPRIFPQILAFTSQLFQVHEADGVHVTSRVRYPCERGWGLCIDSLVSTVMVLASVCNARTCSRPILSWGFPAGHIDWKCPFFLQRIQVLSLAGQGFFVWALPPHDVHRCVALCAGVWWGVFPGLADALLDVRGFAFAF